MSLQSTTTQFGLILVIVNDLPAPAPSATRLRLAAALLGLAMIAAVMVALPVAPTDLDRHQFPKEAVLHLAVLAAGLVAGRGVLDTLPRAVRILVGVIVLWSVLGLAVAVNPWLAVRAIGLTATGALAFATAHFLGRHGQRRMVLAAAVIAALLGVSGALAQAWGLDHRSFADLRAPGGTLGNRNFVAHLAAMALPLAVTGLLAATRRRTVALTAVLSTAIVVTLILTRSRAGWLAALAAVLAVIVWLMLVPGQFRDTLPRKRFLLVPGLALIGVVIAMAIPNTLEWRSDSPYTDTLGNLTNYREGSGRGRLLQYQHTMTLAFRHPLLGVGAGNWPLRYGEVAPSSDPSWARNDVIPLNPWPSSDWMALVSERGILAPIAVLLLGASLLLTAFRRRRDSVDHALRGAAMAGILVGALITGLFDAVMLLAVPLGFVAITVGALLPTADDRPLRPVPRILRQLLIVLVLVGAVRSVQQTAAYLVAGGGTTRAALARGARIDPFSFPLQIELGRSGPCRTASLHARAALRLAPTWASAQRAAKRCR